jgi:hypothetical protein
MLSSKQSTSWEFYMAYFPKKMTATERGGKIAADICCAVLLLLFSVVFFGPLGGLAGWLVLELAPIGRGLPGARC